MDESTRAFGVFNPTAIRWAVVIESYEGVEGPDAVRSTDYMVDKVQWNSFNDSTAKMLSKCKK